ncbi:hypothetical protein [Paenibacillus gansuensis]|uniref:Transposase n=1 Tax=Paenibacillus gansuensis TaxID=306542 RepID=A0ABW5P8X9_9BACL
MLEYGFDRLAEAKEQLYRLEKAQRRQKELRSRLHEKEKQIIELEMKLEAFYATQRRVEHLSWEAATN